MAINETRKRVLEQINKFKEITGGRKCKDDGCSNMVVHPKQLCDDCRARRKAEQKRTYKAKQVKKIRYCKCGTSLEGLGNSVKYCSDDCRPRKQVTARSLANGEREPRREAKSKINPFFLRRGKITYGQSGGGYSVTE